VFQEENGFQERWELKSSQVRKGKVTVHWFEYSRSQRGEGWGVRK
jgi:hypothetical protein